MHDAFFLAPSGNQYHALAFFYSASVAGGDLRNTILKHELTVNPHYIDPSTLTVDDMPFGFDAIQKLLEQLKG